LLPPRTRRRKGGSSGQPTLPSRARTSPLPAWPSASFLGRITEQGAPPRCTLSFAAYTMIIADVFLVRSRPPLPHRVPPRTLLSGVLYDGNATRGSVGLLALSPFLRVRGGRIQRRHQWRFPMIHYAFPDNGEAATRIRDVIDVAFARFCTSIGV